MKNKTIAILMFLVLLCSTLTAQNTFIPGNLSVNGIIYGNGGGITNVLPGYNLSQFGGIGDGQRLVNVSITNGSPLIYSPSGIFKASDVGKGCCLFLDGTNILWVKSKILSIQNSNTVTLSSNATKTITHMTFVWGTDNTIAISNAIYYAWNNGGGQININYGIYCMWKDPVVLGDVNDNCAVIDLPYQDLWMNLTTNLTHKLVQLIGSMPSAGIGISSSSNYPTMTGTILWYAGYPPSGHQNKSVFNSGHNASFAEDVFEFDNIIFRSPVISTNYWWFNFAQGGSLVMRNFSYNPEYIIGFTHDPASGYGYAYSTIYSPFFSKSPTAQAGFAYCPQVNNDALITFDNGEIMLSPLALRVSEHFVGHKVQLFQNGVAVAADGANFLASFSQCDMNCNGYTFASTGTGPIPLYVDGLDYSGFAGGSSELWTNYLVYDPQKLLGGHISYGGNSALTIPSHLTTISLEYVGSQGGVNSNVKKATRWNNSRSMSTELGANAINNGLIYDMPYIIDFTNSANATCYDRSPIVHGDINFTYPPSLSGTNIWVQSPDGLGVLSTYGLVNALGSCLDTNDVGVLTNATLDILINNSSPFSIFPSSGQSTIGFTAANYFVYYRVRTTVGLITLNGYFPGYLSLGVNDGNWHDVCITYDGANIRGYVDGTLVGLTAQTGNIVQETSGFTGDQGTTVAHARMWKRALSPMEVQNLAVTRGLGYNGNVNNITNFVGSYLANWIDGLIIETASTNSQITFVDPNGAAGRSWTVKNEGSGLVTVKSANNRNIDGSTSGVIITNNYNNFMRFTSDGTVYHISGH